MQPNGRPPIHCLAYGEMGTRKSSFAATWPKPVWIALFDPPDKAMPYLREGTVQHEQTDWHKQQNIEMCRVIDPKSGDLLYQVEYFGDSNPEPEDPRNYDWGYRRFRRRVGSLDMEARRGDWATVVLDSLTFCQYSYLRYSEKALNPTYKDGRLHYGDMKREVVNQLLCRFVWLPCNVVVIAHVSTKKDTDTIEWGGFEVRGANAVGTLVGELPAGYGEVYRFKAIGASPTVKYELQTRTDNQWYAGSQIRCPNPCEPVYESLWQSTNQ